MSFTKNMAKSYKNMSGVVDYIMNKSTSNLFNGGKTAIESKAEFKRIEKMFNAKAGDKKGFQLSYNVKDNKAMSNLEDSLLMEYVLRESLYKTFGDGITMATCVHTDTDNTHCHCVLSAYDLNSKSKIKMSMQDSENIDFNIQKVLEEMKDTLSPDKYKMLSMADFRLEEIENNRNYRNDENYRESAEHKAFQDKKQDKRAKRKELTKEKLDGQCFNQKGEVKKGVRYKFVEKYNQYLADKEKDKSVKLENYGIKQHKQYLMNTDESKKARYVESELIQYALHLQKVNLFEHLKELDDKYKKEKYKKSSTPDIDTPTPIFDVPTRDFDVPTPEKVVTTPKVKIYDDIDLFNEKIKTLPISELESIKSIDLIDDDINLLNNDLEVTDDEYNINNKYNLNKDEEMFEKWGFEDTYSGMINMYNHEIEEITKELKLSDNDVLFRKLDLEKKNKEKYEKLDEKPCILEKLKDFYKSCKEILFKKTQKQEIKQKKNSSHKL